MRISFGTLHATRATLLAMDELTGERTPFRAPHHSASAIGCAEETNLAAGGVLYLDEPEEFQHQSIAAIAHRLERWPIATLPAAIVISVTAVHGAHDAEVVKRKARNATRRAAVQTTLSNALAARFPWAGGKV
jgi:predicted ATPase with chaperone activity